MPRKLAARWNPGALAATIKRREGTPVRWSLWGTYCFCGFPRREATAADVRGSLAAVGSGQAVAVGARGPGVGITALPGQKSFWDECFQTCGLAQAVLPP